MRLPTFPLGRLFWKFLLFFFLAQTIVAFGVGLAFWFFRPDRNGPLPPPPPTLSAEHRPGGAVAERAGERPPPPPSPVRIPVFHLAVGAMVSLLFAALLAAYVARPIHRLRAALQQGANGDLSPGLADSMGRRNDELTDLCRDFDHMAKQVALLMEGQRRLLHDVSHELRAPLARLTAVIGLIRQQPDRLDDSLSRLEREAERMDRLLSELLTLSRLESGMVKRGDELIDMQELLHDVVSDVLPEAAQAGCEVDFVQGAAAMVKGDPEMLHRVFDNLLRNALRHAVTGKWVRISVLDAHGEACASVEDRGPGVLSSEIEQIFQPFYRGSHSMSGSGHGLGLVIAKQIVEAHDGRIEAVNRPEGGLCLCVCLPIAQKTKASD